MDTFYLEDYIGGKTNTGNVPNMSFERLCEAIKDDFIQEWDRDGELSNSCSLHEKPMKCRKEG
jgi:hypothetical protein